MSTSITKGPAFEIRFCEGNKVQVFDLSKRGDQSGNQLLPNEYLEDDVVNGRLRYSKLGNQWLSDDAGTNHHRHQQTFTTIPDDQNHATITKKPDDNLDLIPVVAKRKAIEDAKELESIRQGEEAMRKAMERKKKIEMVRRARQQAAAAEAEAAEAAEATDVATDSRQTNDHTQENPAGMNVNNVDDKDMKKESTNEQDPQHQFDHEKDQTFATEMNSWGRSTRTNQNPTLIQDNDPLSTSPLPDRLNKASGGSLRDSGASIHTDNSSGKTPHPENNISSFPSYPSPVPPRTASSSPLQQPVPVYHQQLVTPHYYPQQQQQQQQQQQPQKYEFTEQPKQDSYQAPLEDSFFHQDNTSDKNKPSTSSSCCCIIS